jgi:hypothetical protein
VGPALAAKCPACLVVLLTSACTVDSTADVRAALGTALAASYIAPLWVAVGLCHPHGRLP